MSVVRAPLRLPNWIPEAAAFGVVMLAFLILSSSELLFFHTAAEIFSLMFASAVFFTAWNAARFSPSSYLAALGGTFVCVGVLDMLHALAYPGLNLLPGAGGNLAEQLWISSRLIQSLSLLALPLFIARRFQPRLVLLAYLLLAALLLVVMTQTDLFPVLFMERFGILPLGRHLEWLPLILFGLAGLGLTRNRGSLEPRFFWSLLGSIAASMVVSLAGALNTDPTNHASVIVHLFKLISFYLAYKAVVETGFLKPFGVLFSDLRRQERANRQQKDLLQAIFDVDPSALAVLTGPDLIYRMANQSYRLLTPHPEIDPIGRRFDEIWPASEGLAGRQVAIRKTLETGQSMSIENISLVFPDGRQRHFRTHYQATVWNQEPAVLAVLWDVTELEQARQLEQSAAEASQLLLVELQELMDALPVVVMISLDKDSSRVIGNSAAFQMMGLPGQSGLHELPPPPGGKTELPVRSQRGGMPLPPAGELPLIQAARTGEVPPDMDFEIVQPDGSVRSYIGTIHPLRDANGQPDGAIAALIDITERVRAQEALQASEARFRSLVDSMDDIIFTLDTNLLLTGVYGRFEQHFGTPMDGFIGRSIRQMLTFVNASDEPFLRALQGETVTFEWSVPVDGQPHYFQTVLSPVLEQQRVTGLVGVGRDTTTQRLAEQELERRAQKLERSNRELDQFAHVVSHDLQEPLRKMRYFGQVLQSDYADKLDERGADYLTRVLAAGARMQTMIADLLTFSRVTTRSQPFERVDLNEVANEILADMDARLLVEKAQVAVDPLPELEADPRQMGQLLQNLLSNALKYRRPEQPASVRVWSEPDPRIDWVRFSVRDEGIGFDPSQTERIFKPFERLHGRSEYEGSGIGLAICRKIVERHGGIIEAASQPGQGATFTVRLPRQQG